MRKNFLREFPSHFDSEKNSGKNQKFEEPQQYYRDFCSQQMNFKKEEQKISERGNNSKAPKKEKKCK